jgi:hypothetical protein
MNDSAGKTCSICSEWHRMSEYDYGNRPNRSYCRRCNKEERAAYNKGGTKATKAYRDSYKEKKAVPLETGHQPTMHIEKEMSKHEFSHYQLDAQYNSTAAHNTASWNKIQALAKTEPDGVMSMESLVTAVKDHPKQGGARGFILYCCRHGWLQGVSGLK